ncbi:hypothetical protein H2200_009814 [Cladophialophora chaetospira]|uniref:Uncharacterized protein n=1 Tax=Cladophialophora chaetospira TaxID=386627 RepID=A0AA38X3E9_9EURO|nr:hypothetical protein H2200_009814 [Cladophialophora chaetospira]
MDLEQQLQLFFDKEGVSVELLGRIYAAAATFAWVWKDINEMKIKPLPLEVSIHLKALRSLVPDMTKLIQTKATMIYLDEVVGPGLPAQARVERNKFHDVLMSLRDPSPPRIKEGSNDRETWDTLQKQKHLEYSQQVENAFLKAHQLRLKLEKSAKRYIFMHPMIGTKFDGTWMKAANTAGTIQPHGKSIWACLNPAVYSAPRDTRSPQHLEVSALVLVQGFPLDHYVTNIQ